MEPNRVPEAGGELQFGGFKYRTFPGTISNLNIWDRKLREEDIVKMAQSCDAPNSGNVKDWSDIRNELNLDLYTITKPSSCKNGQS